MSEITLRSVRDVDVAGKRVLLRTSLNVPLTAKGAVADTYRLRQALPTIEMLAAKGAKIILAGYIGRDAGTLAPVATALQELLPGRTVSFSGTPARAAGGEVSALSEGSCLMLENMRREPGEEHNDDLFAHELAALADIFIDDAFAEAHRPYASNVGVASLLPSYAGLLLEEEVVRLSAALTPPKNAIAIVGGAKFETKQPLLKRLLSLYPTLLLGGALANDLLRARGMSVGASMVSDMSMPAALAGDERILEPTDVVVESSASRSSSIADIRADEHIVDIGPSTAKDWAARISQSSFVVWNGPMGVYEKGYTEGTDTLAKALVDSACSAVVGGGDTDAAIAQFQFDPARIFVSTGGGAMLEFLSNGGSLPAIDVLRH